MPPEFVDPSGRILFPHPQTTNVKSEKHKAAELAHQQAANTAGKRGIVLTERANNLGPLCTVLPNSYNAKGKAIVTVKP